MLIPPPQSRPGASREQRYIDWFLWARGQQLDDQRCHGAAGAALRAETVGQEPTQAAVTGARKAQREDISPKTYERELCNWYVWATTRNPNSDEALAVAKAVATAIDRGMSQPQALDIALAYERGDRSVRLGFPLWKRLLRDPGTWLSGLALLLLVLAAFTEYRLEVGVLSLLMFAVPIRARKFLGRFTPMLGVATLLNLLVLAAIALNIKL
ncbi:MAG: hypothetical protein QOJ10_669 [Chloroflexota bacterium]|nr:hypothetical protein [Chloroflexota bacterium]